MNVRLMEKSKEFKVEGIRNLMKTNYGLTGYEIDLEAQVDSSLSFHENWFKLKDKVLSLCDKKHKWVFR